IFLNNHSMLHARDSFVDDDEGHKKRHVVKMWLKHCFWAWKLPSPLHEGNFGVYGQNIVRERWELV
ncbi:hypothetical protein QBC44DRAFT_206582, partial [Cladorrhinum sp. PSN332]